MAICSAVCTARPTTARSAVGVVPMRASAVCSVRREWTARISRVGSAGAFFDGTARFYRKAYLRWIDATKRRPKLRLDGGDVTQFGFGNVCTNNVIYLDLEPSDAQVKQRMDRQRTTRISLGLIAVFTSPAAVQATFAPKSFFDDFPLGMNWISGAGDLYNEHLTRDVGGLFTAMIIVTAWTLWRRHPTAPIATAWLIQAVLHAGFHIGHLNGYETIDKLGLLASLAAIPVLATVALWAGRAPHADSNVP